MTEKLGKSTDGEEVKTVEVTVMGGVLYIDKLPPGVQVIVDERDNHDKYIARLSDGTVEEIPICEKPLVCEKPKTGAAAGHGRKGRFTLDGMKFKWHEDHLGRVVTVPVSGSVTVAWFSKNYDGWRAKCLEAVNSCKVVVTSVQKPGKKRSRPVCRKAGGGNDK